jgi:beta-lactamase class D
MKISKRGRIGKDEGEGQAQNIFSIKSQKKIPLTIKKMPIKVQEGTEHQVDWAGKTVPLPHNNQDTECAEWRKNTKSCKGGKPRNL